MFNFIFLYFSEVLSSEYDDAKNLTIELRSQYQHQSESGSSCAEYKNDPIYPQNVGADLVKSTISTPKAFNSQNFDSCFSSSALYTNREVKF